MTNVGFRLALIVFSLGLSNYSSAERINKTANGDEFRLASEKRLEDAGVKDLKKFGEAWEDPTGKIWSDIAKKEDGSALLMNFKDADTYCHELETELPSGYDEERNGKEGFPNVDSDFVRLRRYRRVNSLDGYEPLDPKAKQVLPNLTRVDNNGKRVNLWFWSSSVSRAGSSHDCYSFDGNGVDVSQYTLCEEEQRLAVRCVVNAPSKSGR